ncbi:MAG: alanine dehydrogenase [Bacteroidota bacterium]|jgi:alanine dehydrogenase
MSEDKPIKLPKELVQRTPQEESLALINKPSRLFIGIPKESTFQENRIPITPEAVDLLINNGARVVIESKAGEGSHYYDTDYSEVGAEIVFDKAEVFKADVIIKSAPITADEIKLMSLNQTLITPIHLPTLQVDILNQLMTKRITALATEYIRDSAGTFPIVRSMSEIAGIASVLVGSELLSNRQNGKGVLLGGITGVPPATVVILGAGTVGEFAAQSALGLGAEVRVFDNSIYKLKRLQNAVGHRVFTCVLREDILSDELKNADITIGAIHSKSGRTPVVVTEHMVSHMKAGSVIIDVSIDQGGCFETSEVTNHDKPYFKKYDVLHYCVPNIASRVPRTASAAISNVITPIIIEAGKQGGFDKLLYNDSNLRHGVYVYKGACTNLHLSNKFKLKFTDLDLLFATTY